MVLTRSADGGHRRFSQALMLGLVLVTCVLPQVGCSCWRNPLRRNVAETPEEIEQKKKELAEKKKAKPDFEVERLAVLPYDDRSKRSFVKPGHWTSAQQLMKANNFDFSVGQLDGNCLSRTGQPLELPNSSYVLHATRAASLPKGTMKRFDLTFFPPTRPGTESGQVTSPQLQTVLRNNSGREVSPPYIEPTQALKSHQYFFVVLAETPAFYSFWNEKLPALKPFRGGWDMVGIDHDYVLVMPNDTQVTVPSDPLAWTSTAYVLWDGFQPAMLTLEQQSAMLDWLHWGGQIIVSGPASLDVLAGSLLLPYLPARGGKATAMTDAQATELNANWSVRHPQDDLLISAEKPPETIELLPHNDAQSVAGTAELVWERRIGRGRIVVTAFSLTHRRLTTWPGFDNFVNGCLLRRPPREFQEQKANDGGMWNAMQMRLQQQMLQQPQAGGAPVLEGDSLASDPGLTGFAVEAWSGVPRVRRDDPRLTSNVRFFARDASSTEMLNYWAQQNGSQLRLVLSQTQDTFQQALGRYRQQFGEPVVDTDAEFFSQLEQQVGLSLPELEPNETYIFDDENDVLMIRQESEAPAHPAVIEFQDDLIGWSVAGFSAHPLSGVSGWNDQSHAAQAARRALDQSSGIKVPSADFVAKMLGVYLLALVPLNWLVFRLMGRVEWAWAAIPFIAAGGTIAVVRLAQLDIGFARSRTEVGILEIQSPYHRAHLSRFAGLYTSLSTSYEIELEDTSSVAQPLSTDHSQDRILDNRQDVRINRSDHVTLSGLGVSSNSTGMIHTEQFLDLGGSLSWQQNENKVTVANQTNVDMHGAAVLHRTLDDKYRAAWLGDLASANSVVADLFDCATTNLVDSVPQWNDSEVTSPTNSDDTLSLYALLKLAASRERLGLGQTTLIGWTDTSLPGIKISPDAAQVVSRTLIVANLRQGQLPQARSDANAWQMFATSPATGGDDSGGLPE